MRTSIATVCLSGTLTQKLHACADAGFDGVEVFEPDLVAAPQSPEEIRALADRLGLTLDLFQPFRDAEGVDAGDVRRQPAAGRGQVRPHAAPGHGHDAGLQQRRHRHRRRRRRVGRPAARARRPRRGVRRPARVRGAGLGPLRRRLPPRLADRRAGRPPAGRASASTASTSSPAATTRRRSSEIPGEKVFFLQLADAPAAEHGRAVVEPAPPALPRRGRLRPRGVPRARARAPATTARSRWRSSTTPSGRPTPTAPRGRRCARCAGWRTRRRAASAARPAGLAAPPRGGGAARASTSSRSGPRTPATSRCCSSSWASRSAAGTAARPVGLWTQGGARVVLNEQQARDLSRTSPPWAVEVRRRRRLAPRAPSACSPRPCYRRTYAGEERWRPSPRPRRDRGLPRPRADGRRRAGSTSSELGGHRDRTGAGDPRRPRQPRAAVAALRRGGALLQQRARPGAAGAAGVAGPAGWCAAR